MDPLFEHAFLVIDTETAGPPGRTSGFDPQLVEVGAVVVTTDGRLVSPIGFLVRQPERHLRDARAADALRINGVTVDQILAEGLESAAAADRMMTWVEAVRDRRGVAVIRAFNQDFGFLPGLFQALAEGAARGDWQVFAAMRASAPAEVEAARALGVTGAQVTVLERANVPAVEAA